MARQEGCQGGEGRQRERIQEVCFLHCQHESRQVDIVNLELLATKLFIGDVTPEEGPGEEYWQEDGLLKEAGEEIEKSIRPRPKEPGTIRETVAKDSTCHPKGYQELYQLVLFVIISAF